MAPLFERKNNSINAYANKYRANEPFSYWKSSSGLNGEIISAMA
jgi:hypothetical protein